jgi:hypothetical protein
MKSSFKFSSLVALGLSTALLSGTVSMVRAEAINMTTDGALQIEAELRAHLKEVGVPYPDGPSLTFGQVEELLVMFDLADKTPGKPTQEEMSTKAANARLILSRIATHVDLTHNNLGAIQIEDELNARLKQLGLTPPPLQALTIAQTRELISLFKTAYKSDSNPTESEKASVAASAKLILSRIEHPTVAGEDTAAMQMHKDQLRASMASIGMAYPTKELTLNQLVALQAVFDAKDTDAIKGAADPAAARTKVQVDALTALLATM